MQQYLPFTVLKLIVWRILGLLRDVATAPTVYGIETKQLHHQIHDEELLQQHLAFTVCVAECEAAEKRR